MKRKIIRGYIILFIILISSCRGRDEKQSVGDKLPKTPVISRAERISISLKNGYTEVTIIDPWQGTDKVQQVYQLVGRKSKLPDGIDSSRVIFVPLKKIICMSTTHVAMISALGEENTIKGISGTGFLFSPDLIKRSEEGMIADVGYEANLNKELILKIKPDLIMMYGIGSESAGYVGKLRELGIKVIFNADYLEKDPLSKTEWIKLFGALYSKESLADSIYRSEVDKYDSIKMFVNNNITSRPKVLLGLPFKDTWYISPGNSYISRLIEDAGGDYLWHDTKSLISMPFGIENVYLRALTADYWLNIGSVTYKNEISLVDQRLKELPCFKKDNLYNNNKRITTSGGNDYWESGSLYPHLILHDIASILHPGLFREDTLFFYRKIN